MSVLIVGAGSAALHHAFACQELGLNYTVAVREGTQKEDFLSRFVGRYFQAPKTAFISTQDDWSGVSFDVAIVATPPATHSELLIRLSNSNFKVIYVEKPLATSPSIVTRTVFSGIKLFTGSQMVLSSSFAEFLRLSLPLMSRESTTLEVNYREPLTGPATAHSWNPEFTDGWITDEEGGGVLSEYSHALFWAGLVMKNKGLTLPSIQAKVYSTALNKNSRTSLDHVEMSFLPSEGVEGRITQSWRSNLTQKNLSIVCLGSGDSLHLEVSTDLHLLTLFDLDGKIQFQQAFNSNRQNDANRLMTHLIRIAEVPSTESPLSLEIALWVDASIAQVREIAFR